MLEAMEKYFPKGVNWTRPMGGMFLWATLPEGINTVEMFEKAVALKVAYVPGISFFAKGGGENTMRLNFSNANPEMIEEGIHRLGKVIREAIEAI
jgi:2-aminoadipate transaminase